jgi:hypothetical protein
MPTGKVMTMETDKEEYGIADNQGEADVELARRPAI